MGTAFAGSLGESDVLHFISLFDWDDYAVRRGTYVKVRIDSISASPEFIGCKALIAFEMLEFDILEDSRADAERRARETLDRRWISRI